MGQKLEALKPIGEAMEFRHSSSSTTASVHGAPMVSVLGNKDSGQMEDALSFLYIPQRLRLQTILSLCHYMRLHWTINRAMRVSLSWRGELRRGTIA